MTTPPTLQRGWRRLGFVTLGLFFVGMAWIGIVLPGIPATPFLLLASYCFVRSSPRLHRWLHRSPIFGRLLHDWETHRGMRLPAKITAMTLVPIAVTCSIIFSSLPVYVKVIIGVAGCVGLTVISLIPTVRTDAPSATKTELPPTHSEKSFPTDDRPA